MIKTGAVCTPARRAEYQNKEDPQHEDVDDRAHVAVDCTRRAGAHLEHVRVKVAPDGRRDGAAAVDDGRGSVEVDGGGVGAAGRLKLARAVVGRRVGVVVGGALDRAAIGEGNARRVVERRARVVVGGGRVGAAGQRAERDGAEHGGAVVVGRRRERAAGRRRERAVDALVGRRRKVRGERDRRLQRGWWKRRRRRRWRRGRWR